jgi:hypothetical protein
VEKRSERLRNVQFVRRVHFRLFDAVVSNNFHRHDGMARLKGSLGGRSCLPEIIELRLRDCVKTFRTGVIGEFFSSSLESRNRASWSRIAGTRNEESAMAYSISIEKGFVCFRPQPSYSRLLITCYRNSQIL